MLNREAKMKWGLLNNDNGYFFGAIRVGEVTSKRKAIESPETTEFCRFIGSTSYFIKLHLLTV